MGNNLIGVYYYGGAIWGTFVYNRIQKIENPNYRSTPKWVYYLGIPCGVLVLAVGSYGLLMKSGMVPEMVVMSGSKMLKKDLLVLIENKIIEPNEEIKYFYSDGLLSILEARNILTHRRVIRYAQDAASELQIYEMFFDDIANIKLIEQGNYITNSIYEVRGFGKDAWMRLALSPENRGDVKFIEALRNKIHNNHAEYGVEARRRYGYVDKIKSNLRKAADAQKLYFDKNNSYKSCAPCAARDLPGYNNNPKVTLVAEIGRRDFVLVATHERCGGSQWIYQRSTGKITGPNAIDSCTWRP